jgi:hypothetical protein
LCNLRLDVDFEAAMDVSLRGLHSQSRRLYARMILL